MDFAKLNYEYFEKRKQKTKRIIFLLFSIPYAASFFFIHIFWCSLVFWIMSPFLLVYLGWLGINPKRTKQNEDIPPLKLLVVRIICISIAIYGLYFVVPITKDFIYDSPYYFRGDYQVVAGKVDLKTTSTRGYLSQSLEINGVNYMNFNTIDKKYDGRILRVAYLPHSKFIVGIKTFLIINGYNLL